MLNLINPGDGHPLCTFHRAARLDAGGIGEIPFTKDNQVYSSYTQAGLYLLYALTPQPEACLKLFNKNLKFIRVLYGVLEYLPSLFNSGYVTLARQDSGFESGIPHSDPRT